MTRWTHGRAIVISPIVPHPPIDGAHKRTLRLLEAIERTGARVHLLSTDGGEPGGVEALQARGWAVETFPGARLPPVDRVRDAVGRLPGPTYGVLARRLAELCAEGAAFVQAEHAQTGGYLAARLGVPTVWSQHNVDSRIWESIAASASPASVRRLKARNRAHAMRGLERRIARHAELLLCVSDADAEHFRRLSRDVVLVPNGADDALFDVPAEPSADSVLLCARFDYEPNAQGLARFLDEGWPRLETSGAGPVLRLVGRGLTGALRDRAARARGVEVVGLVDDVADELARAAVVLVPLWAGGGTRLKVIEAMAAARPVVGTPLGVEQLGFRDGVHGVVADTPAALAAATVALLGDPARARSLGAAARAHAERWRWPRVTAPAEGAYRRWVDRVAAA